MPPNARAPTPPAARFAAAEQSAAVVQPRAPDWGAYDAAYRGGPISTYGAEGQVGVGLRIALP